MSRPSSARRREAATKAQELVASGLSKAQATRSLFEAGYYEGARDYPSSGWIKGLLRDAARWRQSRTQALLREKVTRGGEPVERIARQSEQSGGESPEGERPNEPREWQPFTTTAKRKRALRRYLGTSYEPDPFFYRPSRTERVVAAIGDLHGNPDPLLAAELIRRKPDLTIVAGDVHDQQYASVHKPMTRREVQHQRRVEHRDESAALRAFFEALLEENPEGEVEYFLGNHDAWSLRAALDALPPGLLELFSSPLDLLTFNLGPRFKAVGQPVIYHFPDGHVQDTGHNNEFIYVCGDVLLSHINKVGGMTETAVSKLYRHWFSAWEHTLGLEHVRVLMQFHAHGRSMKTERGGHMLLIEPGMAASVETESYKHSYAGKWRPGIQGFALFVQYCEGDGWHTDLGSLELVAPRITHARPGKAGHGEAWHG